MLPSSQRTFLLSSLLFLSQLSHTSAISKAVPFSPGFDIEKVAARAQEFATRSWEFGTTAQALLELYDPEYSVFGNRSLPVPTLTRAATMSLAYASKSIKFGFGSDSLADGGGTSADPASLGVSAILLGKMEPIYAEKAKETIGWLMNEAKRHWNRAISHRRDVVELWSDYVYMAPPFLAYYGASMKNEVLIREAVEQCRSYRQVLRANTTAPYRGTWHHIIGPQSADWGLWSTGNAWAAAGMARVLAVVLKAPMSLTWREAAATELNWWVREIIEGAMGSPMNGGLVRNYINEVNHPIGFAETSGSSLLAATVYRMAVLRPKTFGDDHIRWADGIRKVIARNDLRGQLHVKADGVVTPAVNPLNWRDPRPVTTGSPEGQAFVVLMYAAWRDCVLAGRCRQ